jgi:quinoprotein glucose dehydrogenase
MQQRLTRALILSALAVTIFAWVLPAQPQTSTARLTIWSGVYTEEQADRGKELYQSNCSPCHGIALDGVARLKGDEFMERWREFDVNGLHDFISKSMPRARRGSTNRPGSLPESTYVDIIAHIFRSNSFPSGSAELTRAAMKNIQIELRDGPKPLPNGALVQLIGCMTKRGASEWMLTEATEPVRTAISGSSTEDELATAKKKQMGGLQFMLANMGILGSNFDASAHAMRKMQTKGYLTRQPGNNRINVTWMEEIDESCR